MSITTPLTDAPVKEGGTVPTEPNYYIELRQKVDEHPRVYIQIPTPPLVWRLKR